jgi:peptidoglycan/LPS O-acetylase OafA/YrhL
LAKAEQSERAPAGAGGAEPRLAGFDCLRAVAALSILTYHAILFTPAFATTNLWNVLTQLRAGVWVFFVVSGFLLYRPHVAAHRGVRPVPDVRRYALSRVLRIFPAYIVALVILTFIVQETDLRSPGRFFMQLGLLQAYDLSVLKQSYPLNITWSLATELSFYVFLPLYAMGIVAAARRFGVVRAEIGGLALMVVIGLIWQLAAAGDVLQGLWLPNFLPVFAVGMGLAVAVQHVPDGAVPRLRAFAQRATLCWALGFGVLVVKGLAFPGHFGFAQGHTVVPQLCFTLFAFLLVLPFVFGAGGTSLVHRVAGMSVAIFLGTISYGIFLWHQPVIHWIKFDWVTSDGWVAQHPLTTWLFAIAVTVPIATLSWYLVERPSMRLKQRLLSRPATD